MPPGTLVVGDPYPNPAPNGTLYVPVTAPAGSQVQMSIYTTSFKKVAQKGFPHPGGTALLLLELTDDWGVLLPNGIFYLKVMVTDPSGRKFSRTITIFVRR